MDPLTGFLQGPRAQRAFLLRSIMTPPWSLRIEDRAPLTLVAILRGEAFVMPDEGSAVPLTEGELAIVRGPTPYTVADRPETAPRVRIGPAQECTTLEGEPLTEARDLGVRTWGNDPNGETVMLTGTYQTDGQVGRRLVDALPAVVTFRRDEVDHRLVAILSEELAVNQSGQTVVLDRLLDLLLVSLLRTWVARADDDRPSWFAAYADPVVGRALRLLEGEPARDWTVASLAAEVDVSRAGLARRFQRLVGQSPIAHLTDVRLATAADLLLDPDTTVSEVSRAVGYASPFTFSTAFKRVHGMSPRAFRARASSGSETGERVATP